MKKNLLTVFCLLLTYLSFAQVNSKAYEELVNKGRSLFEAKDFQNAAIVYSSAVRIGGNLVTNDRRWTLACYWMKINYPDSAFEQLYVVAVSKDLTFGYIDDIMTDDECFSTLHNDKRWNEVKEKMYLNAYHSYATALKDAVGESVKLPKYEKDFSMALGNKNESVLSHLNDPAYVLLKKKMYDKACKYVGVSIEHFPINSFYYQNMGDCYKAMGDEERSYTYYSRALNIKYKYFSINPDTKLNIDSAITADYQQLSQISGRKTIPTDLMLLVLANRLSKNGFNDKAYSLCKMNLGYRPKSFLANQSMGDYYKAIGDKANEEKFKKLAQQYRPQAPARDPSQELKYDASVATPTCLTNCPVILFDAAHNNYHTASGRYKPYAELMTNDGFKVIENQTPFTKELLAKINVVIIASPFVSLSNSEIKILNDWIKRGGSLLAITDHDNFSFDGLLESLGVQTPETNFTDDAAHARIMKDGVTKNPRHIVFSAKDKLLGDHPIINGRNSSEKINVVMTFSGRTIIAPPESSVLLRLSETATSYLTIEQRTVEESVAVKCKGTRVFGTAFNFGKGKVVAVSEAAMQTVQRADGGFNTPGCDNRQFALNIMRWLTGYLK